MIFYTIHPSKDDDTVVDWAGTQADARAACKNRDAAHPGSKSDWKEHDVPTDKPGLLAWLKKHAVSLGE